jgi:nucleoside 2-deoxyribosyltransferase
MSRPCIYVAGAYSADNVISVLDNIREGTRVGVELMLAGYAPFVPWLDHQFQFYLREGEALTVDDYYEYSIAWLEKADALLVLPNSEHSKGTQREIARAIELGIPVCHTLNDCNNLYSRS